MNALDAAIYGRLAAGTALTAYLGGTFIYSLQVPPSVVPAPKRFVEFGIQGGGDENMTPIRRKNQMLRVKAVSNTSKADAGSIEAYAETQLKSSALTPSGWQSPFWFEREQDFEFTEVDGASETFYHVGAVYRLRYNEA